MVRRWLPCLPVLLLFAAPAPAGDKKEVAPTIVVRVRSLETVLDNFKLLATMVGKEEVGRQLEGLIKQKIGVKGLEGIDPKRPFGFYASVGTDLTDVLGAVAVPISDEKAILGLLENLNYPAKKGDDDVYAVDAKGVQIYFRFAHKYAYITAINKNSVAKEKLVEPSKLFPVKDTAAISMSLRIDLLPEFARKFAVGALEDKLGELQEKQPGETDAQHKFRLMAQKEILKIFENVLFNGREIAGELDINPKTKEFTASLSLTGVPKSKMAENIAALSQAKSVFGAIKPADSAVAGRLNIVVPDEVRKLAEKTIATEAKKALDNIADDAQRKKAEELLALLADNFKTGQIDTAVFFNGPTKDKHYNVLAGIKLTDGEKLGKLVTEVATEIRKKLPADEQKKIKLADTTVGKTDIHRLDIHEGMDPAARKIFGDHPLYVAFRGDGLFVALGHGGLDELKKALAAGPAVSPPAHLEIQMARLAPLIAKTDAQREMIEKMFKDDLGTIRASVSGGDSLRLQFTARLSVLQFFTAFADKK